MKLKRKEHPPASPRERRKASTRRELVLAGRRLLSSEGLYESRIEDITKHAGIAKGTLYLYFRSKEELAVAVVASGFEELREHVSARLEGKREPEEAAEAIFASHVEFFADHPDLMRIFHQVRGLVKFDRPQWRPLRVCLRGHLEFLTRQLARGEASSWPARRRRDLAVFLFGCASGACSVLVSAYPDARLRAWGLAWSAPLARAAAGAAARAPLGGPRSRARRPVR